MTVFMTLILKTLKKMLMAILAEKYLVQLIFWMLRAVAQKTTNKLDDEAVTILENAYHGK